MSRCADLRGTTVPKSISSIEKNTFEPIVDTNDLYLGITSYPNFFEGAYLLYPLPSMSKTSSNKF